MGSESERNMSLSDLSGCDEETDDGLGITNPPGLPKVFEDDDHLMASIVFFQGGEESQEPRTLTNFIAVKSGKQGFFSKGQIWIGVQHQTGKNIPVVILKI